MVQQLIILLVFILAALYVARLVYKSFSSKSGGCAKGCGACSTIDFDKISQQLGGPPRS
ncbi:MAG: FeoB-associated Cys-rich membrane protein [Adhaeribacter sp.]